MAKFVTLVEAIGAIKAGSNIVLPPGCGKPQALISTLTKDYQRLQGSRIFSGLQLGNYDFLSEPYLSAFNYYTWHPMPPVENLIASGKAQYLPFRGFGVAAALRQLGVDVILLQVSPPDSNGYCSLGVSASYPHLVAQEAKLVIAQVNPQVPHTFGESFLSVKDIDYLVEVDEEVASYPGGTLDDSSQKIGNYIGELIPANAVVQAGFGSISAAVLDSLVQNRIPVSIFALAGDGVINLAEHDLLRPFQIGDPCAVQVAEIMGSKRLFEFVHRNPLVKLFPASYSHHFGRTGQLKNFVSINSAIEVDLSGQVNAEFLKGKQFSGPDGGTDFLEASWLSPGGMSIIALPSTAGRGKFSRIVHSFASGAPVTVPRHLVQFVVTEYGVADLRSKSLDERAEALIQIAHPSFREELSCARKGAGSSDN